MSALIEATDLDKDTLATESAEYDGSRITFAVFGNLAPGVVVRVVASEREADTFLPLGDNLSLKTQGFGSGYPDGPLDIKVELFNGERQTSAVRVLVNVG